VDPEKPVDHSQASQVETRRRAVELLGQRPSAEDPATLPEAGLLLHELRVHQIELEMQNDELRRTEEKLAASRASYVELFDLAPVGYLVVDGEGGILSANLTAAQLIGVERADLVGASITRFVLAADQDVFYLYRRRLSSAGERQTCEVRLRRPGEEIRGEAPCWVQLEGRPESRSDGSTAYRIAFADVSQRHEVASRLAASEDLYRSITSASHEAIFVQTSDGRIVAWNDAATVVYGLDAETALSGPEGILRMREWRLTREDGSELPVEELPSRSTLATGEPWRDVVLGFHRGEELRWISVSTSPLIDEGEQLPHAVVVTAADVTEVRAAELAMRESRERLSVTLDSMLDPHVLLEAVRDESGAIVDFVYVDANPAACKYNGLAHDELVGARLLDLLPGHDRSGLFASYCRVVESGEPLLLNDLAYEQELLGGAPRFYDVRAVRIGDCVSYTWRDVTERHEDAAALAASEAAYRLIAENASDVVFRGDNEGIFRWVSASVTALTGWRPEELVGRSFAELIHPDDRARFTDARETVQDGAPVTYEVRVRTAAGGYRWMSVGARPLKDEAGAVVGRAGSWRDIEAEHETRVALEQSEARFRAFTDTAADAIVTADVDGFIAGWNAGAEQMFGYSADEVMGRPVTVIMPERYAIGHPAIMSRVRETDERRIMGTVVELEGLRRDGSEFPIELSMGEWEVAGEHYVSTIIRDISERREAAAALATSAQRLRLATDTAEIGIWTWDFGDDSLVWDERLCDWYEVPDEVRDRGVFYEFWRSRVHPGDLERTEALLAEARAGGVPYDDVFRVVRSDGEIRHIHATSALERDAAGAPLRMIGVNIDVTQSTRLNDDLEARVLQRTAQLDASNKELEQFVYSASHDLRAPLRAIDGFSQMVVEDAADRLDEADAEHLQRVRAAAQRMAVLIDQLMALARSSRQDLRIEQVDVSELAESVIRELRVPEPERAVDSVVTPGMHAQADEALLRAVYTNLLGNAWKFTGKHAAARIEAGEMEVDGERAFYVRDDGAGFDMKLATHLFGAFQRLHEAGEFKGDGIGLATVQRLVARHGGRVWAEAAVEQGATFYFTLPGTVAPV